jgi:cold shock CspA family protein
LPKEGPPLHTVFGDAIVQFTSPAFESGLFSDREDLRTSYCFVTSFSSALRTFIHISQEGPPRHRRGRGFQQSAESGKLYSDDPEAQKKPVVRPPQQDYRTAGVDYRVSEFETEGRGQDRNRPRTYNSGSAYRDGGRGRGSGRGSREGAEKEGGSGDEGLLQHSDGGLLGRGPKGRGPRGAPRSEAANQEVAVDGREYGKITSVKESFGFIQCYRRGNVEIFFHVTGLDREESEGAEDSRKPDLTTLVKIGQEVEFDYVAVDEKSGKPMARRVKVLAPGALDDDISEEVLQGVVDRELRGGQRRKEDAYGGRIKCAAETVEGDQNSAEYFAFDAAGLADPSTRLQTGDQVEFRSSVSKRTGGEKRAVGVKLVSRAERRPAPLKQDGRPGKTGVVVVLKDTFGFVKTEPEGKVFFHFSHVEVGHTDGSKRLQEDDLVDFV